MLLCAAALYVTFVLRASFVAYGERTFSLFDDAMISMTYARNLAAGHGLVWMAGEPPVEGYTNFLWALVMSLPHLAGLPDRLASLPVAALGALLLLVTSTLAYALASRLAEQRTTAALAGAAVAFSFPLVFWTLRGLEVGLVACLVTGGALLALRLAERPARRDLGLLALTLAAAVLTRTDAVVFAVVLVAWLARERRVREAALAAAAVAATLAAHTAFRVAYYGAALPNTYTLKVSGHPLAERLGRGLECLGSLAASTLWAPLALALALLLVRRSSLGRAEQLLLGIVAAAFAYSAYVGGDVWEYADFANRFVAVALPALLVLAVLGIEAVLAARGREAWLGLAPLGVGLALFLFSRSGRKLEGYAELEPYLLVAMLGLLVAVGAQRIPASWHRTAVGVLAGLLMIAATNGRSWAQWQTEGGLHVRDDENAVRQGLAIRAASPPEARVAVIWAGAIPYFSQRRAIDLFGKSDPVIARSAPRREFLPGHDKWDFEYSIERQRPELVVMRWVVSQADKRNLVAWGYENVAGYYVLRGAAIDRAELRAPWR